jgi:hypothetical protein
MLTEFIKNLAAFFFTILAFVAKQTGVNESIIKFLENQKLVNKAQGDVNKAQGDINKAQGDTNLKVAGDIADLNGKVVNLGQIKGNIEYLPYNYQKDANPFKLAKKVVDGVDVYPTASEMLDYVASKLNKPITNGRSYLIQFSGEIPCPIMVDGLLESGDGEESLVAVIDDAGGRSFTYESNPDAEKLSAIESEAVKATVIIGKVNDVTMIGHQNRLDILNGL